MSGVNRNILQNGGIPLAGRGQTNIDLVTTEKSRFVMMNFPRTFLSSSNGGTCEGITLQWTPDPSFGFETASAYYAVTSSTQPCEPASLSPMTSSIGWTQYIESTYDNSTPVYYMRAYQNFVGGGKGPYSDIVSLQTNGNAICPGAPGSSRAASGSRSSATFDANGFVPNSNLWLSNSGASGSTAFVATFSTTPDLVKLGGPNFDAIKTNGATITAPLFGSFLGQGGGTAQTIFFSMALCSGSATMAIGSRNFFVSAVDSSNSGTVTLNIVSGVTPIFPNGINTRNKVIGLEFSSNGGFTVDNVAVGSGGSTLVPFNITGDFVITTSADCVIREFGCDFAGQYPASVYHCKFGN